MIAETLLLSPAVWIREQTMLPLPQGGMAMTSQPVALNTREAVTRLSVHPADIAARVLSLCLSVESTALLAMREASAT